MAGRAVVIVCGVGWLVLAAGVVAPLAGMIQATAGSERIASDLVAVPSGWVLLIRSLALSGVATVGALLLGLLPGAVLGSARGRTLPIVLGLMLAPLLVPPQVYAYAWQQAMVPASPLSAWIIAALPSSLRQPRAHPEALYAVLASDSDLPRESA